MGTQHVTPRNIVLSGILGSATKTEVRKLSKNMQNKKEDRCGNPPRKFLSHPQVLRDAGGQKLGLRPCNDVRVSMYVAYGQPECVCVCVFNLNLTEELARMSKHTESHQLLSVPHLLSLQGSRSASSFSLLPFWRLI